MDLESAKFNLSFAGCGFLCIYHAGVCAAIKEYAPQLAKNKVSGASAGAIAAAGLVCNVCMSKATSTILQVVSEVKNLIVYLKYVQVFIGSNRIFTSTQPQL